MASTASTVLPLLSAVSAATAVWALSRNGGANSSHPTPDEMTARLASLQLALRAKQDEAAAAAAAAADDEDEAAPDAAQWLASLQLVMPAIVTIRIMKVRAFDDDKAMCSVATGFVVDKVRGLILTNRHVVTPGPVVADAIFVNHEEVDLIPLYRDPVHDFGFFRFDPSKIRFLALHEIPLRPDLAAVGTDIRVVGNDNAEKVQILPGILAKLDRDAPQYGPTGYNDFNTFYYSAASSTSGGSSGSPVLNVDGAAVALNAGGATHAASSYFLPLDRVQRALTLLQADAPIPRGTWQTTFRHAAFDEVRKLGLTTADERAIRAAFPTETGVLVVDQVVPLGPAYNHLHVGDIVLSVQGHSLTTFAPLAAILDGHVDQDVAIEVQRGGRRVALSLHVQDLHAITPSQFLEVGDCIFHALSYHQARNLSLPVGSVYATQVGHLLLHANVFHPCLVHSLDGRPTPTLAAFIDVLQHLPHGTRTDLVYSHATVRHVQIPTVVTIDWQWFPMQLWHRLSDGTKDADGLWHATPFSPPMMTSTPALMTSAAPHVTPLKTEAPWATALLSSLVYVRSEAPLEVDGIGFTSFEAIGYVIDATRGYVLVDKCTVHLFMSQVSVIVAASIQLAATVCFVHPVANFSIVQFDASSLAPGLVTALRFAEPSTASSLHVGASLAFLGLTCLWSVLTASTVVTKIDRLVVPDLDVPRYKTSAIEVLHVEPMNASALGGVFVNVADPTSVVALWLEFGTEDATDSQYSQSAHRGVPVSLVHDIVAAIQAGGVPPTHVRVLPVELTTTSLAAARAGLGLSAAWIQVLATTYPDTRQVLTVYRCAAGTQAQTQLVSGDLVLSVNGHVVVKDGDIDRLVSASTSSELSNTLDVVVLRGGLERTLTVETTSVSARGTTRAVVWCGLLLQAPHWTVYQRGFVPCGVYISLWMEGSPADKYAMEPRRFIVQVNDVDTPDLDAFLCAVQPVGQHESVRLKVVTMAAGRTEMRTLKTEYHYWPTKEVVWDEEEGWRTIVYRHAL
ncbi:Aste57867_17514 [Aphanomyces stellatus]|uniref:Aste57867_17514 protein n=1 Tax=Aphanomyces stellatus TaxID=120398 RepID=A0A485L7W2_9STRA|nr:hypothetical protein As57867_017454 [Aphanomyces stellatus]VFT94267.1 Aste57867_17514 [Aphanomyces stellatus]